MNGVAPSLPLSVFMTCAVQLYFSSFIKVMDMKERRRREFLPDLFVVETQPNMDFSTRP